MTDNRMKGRVKGLFGGVNPENEFMEETPGLPDPEAQRQALQVLVLAQRTADDHVATARQQADKIRADARASAEQTARDAKAHAENVRRDAAKALSDARAAADQMARDAQAHANNVRRDAEKILSDTRAVAEQIGKDAQAAADDLDREAQERYQDVVGSLESQRAALQQQIEALQQFDRDYRARLRKFMQGQLDALGVDEPPPPNGKFEIPAKMATTGPSPAQE